ncbi:YslB family protein [Virgibacillus sp. C22-A2]|uniref:YslB family protein n=1 Tax=Virgibacillus tibetensis TaxID=3042313 RepID=A0ABU6KA45_9BACI|nr:YslB family protein [Virgibacillus sp. C22-A2]
MSKKISLLSVSQLDKLHTAGAGYDILRYLCLPELLGRESNTLLYFMGRNLARKFDIKSMEDVFILFEKLGWGRLELIKEKRKETIFYLMADAVVHRLEAPIDADFRLEAGFLAEAVQIVEGIECECMEEINYKIHQIEFSVLFTK